MYFHLLKGFGTYWWQMDWRCVLGRRGGENMIVVWRTLEQRRGDNFYCNFLTLGRMSTLTFQRSGQASDGPLCSVWQPKKILWEKLFYTSSQGATFHRDSDLWWFSPRAEQSCEEQPPKKGRIKPLSSICSCSHAKTKLCHWCSYSGQWYCGAIVGFVCQWLVVYVHLVLFIVFVFRLSSHSCQTMTVSQLELLLKEKVCWPG